MRKTIRFILAFAVLGVFALPQNANASDPFIGEVRVFPYNFAPRNWALCNGQLLSVSQNTALFSLLGTTYGGDGRTTFGLPNLQGRVALHPGRGPGLTLRQLGERGGVETVTLTEAQMPNHNHQAMASKNYADSEYARYGTWAKKERTKLYKTGVPNTTMGQNALYNYGGSQPHNNMPPYLTMGYYIALEGTYPPRN